MRVPTTYQVDGQQETVFDITQHFPHWFGSRFADFGDGNEPHAPWDQHCKPGPPKHASGLSSEAP